MLGGYENTLCTPCALRGALLVGPPPCSPQTPPAPWGWCSSWVGCAGAAVALRCGGCLVPLPALTDVAGDPRGTRLTAPPGLWL